MEQFIKDARRRGLSASLVKANRMSLALGLALTLIGIIHDMKAAPQWAHQFMLLRVVVAGMAAIFLGLMYTTWGRKNINWLLFWWTPIPQTMLAYMIFCTGGIASSYSQGLIFCVVIVTLFPLLSIRQSLFLVTYTMALYVLAIIYGKLPPGAMLPPETTWMHVVTMILLCGFARMVLDTSFKELVQYEHDLSDQLKLLERQHNDLAHHKALAIHEDKMTSLGHVVSSILHQINHPANTALMAIDSAMRLSKARAPELAQTLVDARAELMKISSVSSSWRRMTVQRDATVQQLTKVESVERIVHLALELLDDRARGITIDLAIAPDCYVRCDDAALINVLQYMLDNAVDAVHRAGRNDPRISISAAQAEGEVKLEIRDNGPGIPEHLQADIFLPFFSTHESGKRLGLGLSSAYSEIARHGGSISVSSVPDKETIFTIRLPLASSGNP